jgi:hypothetical protein
MFTILSSLALSWHDRSTKWQKWGEKDLSLVEGCPDGPVEKVIGALLGWLDGRALDRLDGNASGC